MLNVFEEIDMRYASYNQSVNDTIIADSESEQVKHERG